MLPIEKEMIGLIMRGASTPLDNIRVSVFLVAWSTTLLAIIRTAQHEREKQDAAQENSRENRGPTAEGPAAEGERREAQVGQGGGSSFIQPAKRRI
jgi:hypothetical protein